MSTYYRYMQKWVYLILSSRISIKQHLLLTVRWWENFIINKAFIHSVARLIFETGSSQEKLQTGSLQNCYKEKVNGRMWLLITLFFLSFVVREGEIDKKNCKCNVLRYLLAQIRAIHFTKWGIRPARSVDNVCGNFYKVSILSVGGWSGVDKLWLLAR